MTIKSCSFGLDPGPRALKTANSPVGLGEVEIKGNAVGDAVTEADLVCWVEPHALIKRSTMTSEPFAATFTTV